MSCKRTWTQWSTGLSHLRSPVSEESLSHVGSSNHIIAVCVCLVVLDKSSAMGILLRARATRKANPELQWEIPHERSQAMALGAKKKARLFRGEETSEQTLMEDLERYREQALKLGAASAKIIPAHWIIVDERARLKCYIPRCKYYGEAPTCPPFSPDVELTRRAIARYRWGILYKVDVTPAETFTDSKRHAERLTVTRLNADIAGEIESMAFHDGYHLAMGMAQGACKHVYCVGKPCQVLAGGRCKFPLRARPSLEGLAMDVFNLVTKAGWDIYPIGRCVDPASVPSAISVGLVLIW